MAKPEHLWSEKRIYSHHWILTKPHSGNVWKLMSGCVELMWHRIHLYTFHIMRNIQVMLHPSTALLWLQFRVCLRCRNCVIVGMITLLTAQLNCCTKSSALLMQRIPLLYFILLFDLVMLCERLLEAFSLSKYLVWVYFIQFLQNELTRNQI